MPLNRFETHSTHFLSLRLGRHLPDKGIIEAPCKRAATCSKDEREMIGANHLSAAENRGRTQFGAADAGDSCWSSPSSRGRGNPDVTNSRNVKAVTTIRRLLLNEEGNFAARVIEAIASVLIGGCTPHEIYATIRGTSLHMRMN